MGGSPAGAGHGRRWRPGDRAGVRLALEAGRVHSDAVRVRQDVWIARGRGHGRRWRPGDRARVRLALEAGRVRPDAVRVRQDVWMCGSTAGAGHGRRWRPGDRAGVRLARRRPPGRRPLVRLRLKMGRVRVAPRSPRGCWRSAGRRGSAAPSPDRRGRGRWSRVVSGARAAYLAASGPGRRWHRRSGPERTACQSRQVAAFPAMARSSRQVEGPSWAVAAQAKG